MARIIIKEKGFETRSIPVVSGRMLAGRSSRSAIVLRNRYASGEHGEILCDGGVCTIVDRESTNGIFVNGLKVDRKELQNGDRILMGAALLIYIADEHTLREEDLLSQLRTGTAEERELAANILGQMGSSEVAEPLVTVLTGDPESRVKAAAAEALGLVGDSTTTKHLLAFFDTADITVRTSIVRAIIRLADDSAIAGIAAYLNHEDPKTRVLAAYSLGSIKNKLATEALLKALGDDAFSVREAVVKALGDLGDPSALDMLMKAAEDTQRYSSVWVIEALGKIRSLKSLPLLIKAVGNQSAEVREAAANGLGKLSARESVPVLIEAVDDPNQNVRKAAAASLEKLRIHIELEKKLASRPSGSRETMHLSSYGEDGGGEASEASGFGEDSVKWREWWSQNS